VWAVTDGGEILQGDGTKWTVLPKLTNSPLRGIWGFSANDVWVVGNYGAILRGP
jgi:hypothetical protein